MGRRNSRDSDAGTVESGVGTRYSAATRRRWCRSLVRWAIYSDLYLWPSKKYAGYWRAFRFDLGWYHGPVLDVRVVDQWPANPPKVRSAF